MTLVTYNHYSPRRYLLVLVHLSIASYPASLDRLAQKGSDDNSCDDAIIENDRIFIDNDTVESSESDYCILSITLLVEQSQFLR